MLWKGKPLTSKKNRSWAQGEGNPRRKRRLKVQSPILGRGVVLWKQDKIKINDILLICFYKNGGFPECSLMFVTSELAEEEYKWSEELPLQVPLLKPREVQVVNTNHIVRKRNIVRKPNIVTSELDDKEYKWSEESLLQVMRAFLNVRHLWISCWWIQVIRGTSPASARLKLYANVGNFRWGKRENRWPLVSTGNPSDEKLGHCPTQAQGFLLEELLCSFWRIQCGNPCCSHVGFW